MNSLVAIVGPTAVGKSHLAMLLAQTFDGEIVSADSRQVYRYMDIGTAKPTPDERALIRHHLIDVVDPDEEFNLALYQEMAYQAVNSIHHRGKLAFLVGGSGLYIRSVVNGFRTPPTPPNPELRSRLEATAQNAGVGVLYDELKRLDPAAAQKINPRNIRRVIRALEVCQLAGKPFSQLQQSEPPPFPILTIGLTTDRDDLYQRTDSRIDSMVERGWIDEVQGLLQTGYGLDLPSMSGVGYRQIGEFLQGKVDLSAAIQRIKFETHRIVRHQYAWFRRDDPRIHWFDVRQAIEEPVLGLIREFAEM